MRLSDSQYEWILSQLDICDKECNGVFDYGTEKCEAVLMVFNGVVEVAGKNCCDPCNFITDNLSLRQQALANIKRIERLIERAKDIVK